MTGWRPEVAGAAGVPALAAGLALPALARCGPVGWAAAFAIATVAACLWRPGRLALAVAATAVAAGAGWSAHRLAQLDAAPLVGALGTTVEGRVTVVGRPSIAPFGTAAVARFAGAAVYLRVHRPVETGDVLSVRGRLAAPRASHEPGGFDEREWLARQGVHAVLRADSAVPIARRGGVAGAVDGLRRHARGVLARGGDGPAARVAAGVLLGSASELPPATLESFRDAGLAHLLAVSGGNVALLVALVLWLAWVAGLPRAVGHGLAVPTVVLYALVVGPSPSVVRAAVAGVAVSVAWLANRPADRWHVLALAAAVTLALDPWAVAGPGFQLSFAAVVAIFTVAPRVQAWLEGVPCPARLRGPIAISAACTLATAPIALWHFGRASLAGSLPANLLAWPAVAPLLWLALVAVALAPVLPGAATALVWGAHALGAYLVRVAELGAALDARRGLLGLAVGGVMATAGLARRGRGGVLAVAAAAVVVALAAPLPGGGRPPPDGLRVTFLDVGQGSAALLEAPGLAVLVDAGPRESDVAGRLRALGVAHLDLLVLTHPQADHVGGARDVLERLAVDRVLDPAIASEQGDERAALAAARERGVPAVVARAGLVWRAGRLQLRVLGPRHVVPGADPNDGAVVLEASQGGCRFLLPADAEARSLLPLGPGQATVLGVSHHGSADPDLPRLLRQVRPRLAVISVGARNRFGHPAPATLAALRAAGVPVRRTDRDGDVTVSCP